MIQTKVTVANFAGIHVRPSGVIIQSVQDYSGRISVTANGMETDLTNIMGLIAMGLAKGDEITIAVDGPEEEKMLETLTELFSRHFDFPPRGSV
jgi:phosphotransferase system HPr (HPr) family protein